ncbi:MAG: hypothetical protein ABFS42_00200 [Candidatus Krumholzibacteriota bacterium]
MPGDGVSLPTTLAQMGNVARTQARGQQASPQVTPFSEQKDDKNELKIQGVKETTEAEQSRVIADQEENDKRKRRRLKRRRKRITRSGNDQQASREKDLNNDQDDSTRTSVEEEEDLGSLIDMRV